MNNVKYIIRKRALGDVLWIEPVVRAFAKNGRKIVVHTRFNALFQNFPFSNVQFKDRLSFIEKCLVLAEKILGLRFLTLNLDRSYESKPTMHFLHAYQRKAGLPIQNEYPRIYLSEEEEHKQFLREKYIVLHLESFSSKPYRKVFGVNWEEIISDLAAKGYKVVQVGANTSAFKGAITIDTSIRDLISLIHGCSFFVGIDSGPSHIAASLKKPSLIFFGAIDPDTRHFRDLFKGILLKQPCEYDSKYHKVVASERVLPCRLSADPKVAKCCIYDTHFIALQIDTLINNYAS